MPAFGIVLDDIANGATGTIVIGGEVSGINTSLSVLAMSSSSARREP